MLNPVVNISGSTTTSVVPASGSSTASKCSRFAAASCHTSGCWMSVTRSFVFSAIVVAIRPEPMREGLQPRDRIIQCLIGLRDTEPQHREPRRILVERRERDGGDPRLGEEPLGELDVR